MGAGKLTMVYAGKGRRRKTIKTTPYKKVYKRKNTFKQKVLKIVGKQQETNQLTQTIYDTASSLVNFNSAIQTVGECYNVLPDVTRANNSASYQREGDKILPTYCNLRFNMSISSGQPIHAYLYVLMDKNYTDANTRPADTPNFLNLNGGVANFDGSWVNSGIPVDTERFRIIKRKRISLTYDAQPGGSPTAPTETGKLFKELKVSIPMQRYVKQLDYYGYPSTLNQPKNCNMFWAIGYLNADGTSDTVGRLRVTCMSTLYWKDN